MMQETHRKPKLRLWLVTAGLYPKNGQFGVPLFQEDNLLQRLQSTVLLKWVCDLNSTPSDALKDKPSPRSEQWKSWKHVVIEAHSDNPLKVEPGYYLSNLEPEFIIHRYGYKNFFPDFHDSNYSIRDAEMADWNDQRNSQM